MHLRQRQWCTFLLAGSAALRAGSTVHSGAGRILHARLRPMGLHERGLAESTVSLVEMIDGSETDVHGESGLPVTDCCQEIV
ncbi:hypothetical protein GCM10010467_07530 [Actinocorallia glomerata]|uniref:Secreted protein n=2 Tax=Actinomycetes TaxID=1760 RepID=A0ABP6LTL4_9MICC